MRALSIVALLLCCCSALKAQEYRLNISVVNAETKEPVPYATIMYVEQQYGFSANTSGKFSLRVNKVEFQRELSISSIGFEVFKITIGQLVNDDITQISLVPKVTILDELMVRAEAETALSIVQKASKNMPDYLGESPYYLHMFYKEILKKKQSHVGYTEGYGVMHVTSYKKARRTKSELFKLDLVQWKNIRRSMYQLKDDCDPLKPRVLGINKLLKAKVEYLHRGPLSKGNIEDYKFNIDSLTTFQNHDVFIIGFQPKNWIGEKQYQGQIYVNADDYAMLAMSVSQVNSKEVIFNKCDVQSVQSDFKVSYIKVGDQYYLNQLSITNNFENLTEELSVRGGEFQENKVAYLNYDQRVILYNEMINPAISYTSDFWTDNGDEIPVGIESDLIKASSLSNQFNDNAGKRLQPLPPKFKDYNTLYSERGLFKLYFNGDL